MITSNSLFAVILLLHNISESNCLFVKSLVLKFLRDLVGVFLDCIVFLLVATKQNVKLTKHLRRNETAGSNMVYTTIPNMAYTTVQAIRHTRGGVEDIRLEAKAKDTKKIRGQGQPFRGQTLSRLRPRTKNTSASALQKKKKVFTKIFQAISTKKRFLKNFSSAPQNFNNSKNSAVLEPRAGQFSRT